MLINISNLRLKSAITAMFWHFIASIVIALLVGAFVFGVWFPHPFRQLAGGTELFFLIMAVDLVCGPLLTLVLFNPAKPKRELVTDLGLVVLVQLAALVYGLWTLHVARPLYLVHELDRFKVIALADIDSQELASLPKVLQPSIFKGPQLAGLRSASQEERQKVMFESVQGGRDFGERPSFYAIYEGDKAASAFGRAKPLADFAKKHPAQQHEIAKLQATVNGQANKQVLELRYLPIIARQDWVAVLNPQGEIVGYVQGDGF